MKPVCGNADRTWFGREIHQKLRDSNTLYILWAGLLSSRTDTDSWYRGAKGQTGPMYYKHIYSGMYQVQ